jgi:hypothetical protein
MTHRVWITAFACGLSAGFISGCTFTHGHKDETLVAKDDKPPPDLPDVDPPQSAQEKHEAGTRHENPSGVRLTNYAGEGSNRVNSVPVDPTQYGNRPPDLMTNVFLRAADPGNGRADAHVVNALRALLDKRLDQAVDQLKYYDKSVQEPLLLLLPWVARFAEGELNQAKPQDVEKFLEQIEELERALRPRASLTLGQARFCRHVQGFGLVEPLPDDYAFQCGNGGRPGEGVVFYVEANHTAARATGSYYETRLAGRLDILDADGKRVWTQEFPNKPNTSISPRHDYFVIFYFAVPARLPPGHYSLAVELSDQTLQGGKEAPSYRTARRKLPFEIGAGSEGAR